MYNCSFSGHQSVIYLAKQYVSIPYASAKQSIKLVVGGLIIVTQRKPDQY
jgi:hypothetical protein